MTNIYMMIAAGLLVLASPMLILAGQGQAVEGKLALVLASPFGPSAAEIVENARLSTVLFPSGRWAAFVQLDSAEARAALTENGAWMVRDGRAILALCGISPT